MSRILMGNRLVEICGKLWRAGEGVEDRLQPAAALADGAGSRQARSACSACAGDYEDPDRTARRVDREDAEEVEELDDLGVVRSGDSLASLNDRPAGADGFPAREE